MSEESNQDGGEQRVTAEQALNLARDLHRSGRLKDAEALYRKLLEAIPDWPDVLNLLAILRVHRSHEDDAVELLQRAVAIDPDYAAAHNNLGNVFKLLGRLDEAEAAYRRVLELAPEHADAWNNLGLVYRIQDRPEDAEKALRRAIQANPELVDAHYNLGALLHSQSRPEEATESLQRVLALNANYRLAYNILGPLLYLLGRRDEAAEIYRRWLKLSPDHPVALHMLAACTGEDIPERASDHYIRTLFDGHAGSFDENLIEQLHYRAPQLVADVLERCYGAADAGLDVLDAGCGTGLCGPLIKPHAGSLVGVDLSPKMLAEAERRAVYDELVEAELTAFLQAHPDAYDLIVSADTLCYFGQLTDVSRAAAGALRPGGRLVFTVERLADTDGTAGFALTESGRYAHSEDYLRATLNAAGFTVEALDRADLRKEGGRSVSGVVVTAMMPLPR